jgi:8-hydroxy-5-deazaflavin:NADPH oxidoreductase
MRKESAVRVAILGGTGKFGQALAIRMREAGVDVVIGSRDPSRAQTTAAALGVSGATNEEAVRGADLAVLAVKADAALPTAEELAPAIGSVPVLCVASELHFSKDGVRPPPDARALAERVADCLSGPVIACMHSLAAANLGAEQPPDEDAFVCGDDGSAKDLAIDLVGRLVAGHAVDAGPLANARTLEGMTAVIVNINRRYKAHAGIRVTGLP